MEQEKMLEKILEESIADLQDKYDRHEERLARLEQKFGMAAA